MGSIMRAAVSASVKPGMFGSLANPEIDAVSKGCFNDPILFHIKCRYESTIIIMAVVRYRSIQYTPG